MDETVLTAYEALPQKDQLVIDAVIIALHQKDRESGKSQKLSIDYLKRANDLELRLRSLEAED